MTSANRAALAADNFGGQSAPVAVTEDRLAADLAAYDPAEGLANRDFVVAHHAAHRHAAELAALLDEVAGRPPERADAPLQEMGRLVRLYHRADVRAFLLQADHARMAGRLQAAEADAAAWRADAEAANVRADAEARRADTETRRADAEAARAAAAEERAQAAFDRERRAGPRLSATPPRRRTPRRRSAPSRTPAAGRRSTGRSRPSTGCAVRGAGRRGP